MTQKEWNTEIAKKLESIKLDLADYAEYVDSDIDSLTVRIKGKYFIIEPSFNGPSRKKSENTMLLSLRFANLLANGVLSYYKDKKGVPVCLETTSISKITRTIMDIVVAMEETYIKQIHSITKSSLLITMDGKNID